MEIIQKDYEDKGIFKVMEDNTEIGEMTYVWAGSDKIIIDHTSVRSEYANEGVGSKLVIQSVDFARKNKIKILPLCPFAKSVFQKTPEIRDVLFV